MKNTEDYYPNAITDVLPVRGFVLPTRQIIEKLFTDLARMTNADYDIYELITISLASIENRALAELKIVEEMQSVRRFYHLPLAIRLNDNNPQIRESASHDATILAQAWFDFTLALFQVSCQVNIWDVDGICRMYFKRLLGNDLVLCRFPD